MMIYTSLIILLCGIFCPNQTNGRCRRDTCKRKEYTPANGFYHTGKVLAVCKEVPLNFCILRCRMYLECRGFNMKWFDQFRKAGTCTLLQEVYMTSSETGATTDDQYTHYFWCPEPMTYYLRTGTCLFNKSGVDWYEAASFCKTLYPDAHLVDIKSEEEEVAYTDLLVSRMSTVVWTSGKRPNGGGKDEFYWTNSGEAINYTNWRPSQPYEGSPTSDCIALIKNNNYQWDDMDCERPFNALCEW